MRTSYSKIRCQHVKEMLTCGELSHASRLMDRRCARWGCARMARMDWTGEISEVSEI